MAEPFQAENSAPGPAGASNGIIRPAVHRNRRVDCVGQRAGAQFAHAAASEETQETEETQAPQEAETQAQAAPEDRTQAAEAVPQAEARPAVGLDSAHVPKVARRRAPARLLDRAEPRGSRMRSSGRMPTAPSPGPNGRIR